MKEKEPERKKMKIKKEKRKMKIKKVPHRAWDSEQDDLLSLDQLGNVHLTSGAHKGGRRQGISNLQAQKIVTFCSFFPFSFWQLNSDNLSNFDLLL